MYHPAQVVTAYEGGGGAGGAAPGLVTVVAQHPSGLTAIGGGGGVITSQPSILDTSGQRITSSSSSGLYSTSGLAAGVVPQGTQPALYQLKPSGGGGGGGLTPQFTTTLPSTQAQIHQGTVPGNQPMPLVADSLFQQQQTHQQQPMQVYDYTAMTGGAISQALPDLNTLSSLFTMRYDPNLAAATTPRQQVPVSMATNPITQVSHSFLSSDVKLNPFFM